MARDLATAAPVIGAAQRFTPRGIKAGDRHRVCDVALDGTTAGRHHVAAASWIGISHVVAGSCRQDTYGFCLDVRGRLYVVVADGLGSRSVSHLGARTFCDEVLLAAHGCDDDDPADPSALIEIASQGMTRILTEAYGLDPRDAACVAVVGAFEEEHHTFARVGDATAFTLADAAFIELFDNDSTYVNVVDASIPDHTGQAVTATTTDAAIVALVTDGLANDIRTSASVRAWLASQWTAPVTAYAMGDSLRYRRQGSHDDRTAVVVWGHGVAS